MENAINAATEAASNADTQAEEIVETVVIRADEWRELLEARRKLQAAERKYVSLGSTLHGSAVVVGLCSDFCDELVRGDSDVEDKIDELIEELRDLGYGTRDYAVTFNVTVTVGVTAASEDDAVEQAEELVDDELARTSLTIAGTELYDVEVDA